MPIKATDIKRGQALMYEGQLHVVLDTDHVKPGKGPAYIQAKMKNLGTRAPSRPTGSTAPISFEDATIDRRPMAVPLRCGSGQGRRPVRLHGQRDLRPDGDRRAMSSRRTRASGSRRTLDVLDHDLRGPPPGGRTSRRRGTRDHRDHRRSRRGRPRRTSSRKPRSRPAPACACRRSSRWDRS